MEFKTAEVRPVERAMYFKSTEVVIEFDARIRYANIKGKKHNIRKNSTVAVTLKAFFSFKNFSLASKETCWAAICFSCRRVS